MLLFYVKPTTHHKNILWNITAQLISTILWIINSTTLTNIIRSAKRLLAVNNSFRLSQNSLNVVWSFIEAPSATLYKH